MTIKTHQDIDTIQTTILGTLPVIIVPAQLAASQGNIYETQIPLIKPASLASLSRPIYPNANTFSPRNTLFAKQSTTYTATQQILFATYFTSLSAAIFTNIQSALEPTPVI